MPPKGGDKTAQFWAAIQGQKQDTIRWSFGYGGINTFTRDDDGGSFCVCRVCVCVCVCVRVCRQRVHTLSCLGSLLILDVLCSEFSLHSDQLQFGDIKI